MKNLTNNVKSSKQILNKSVTLKRDSPSKASGSTLSSMTIDKVKIGSSKKLERMMGDNQILK